MKDEFEVVRVKDGMLGGHYAVEHQGRMIGRSFRLDRHGAEVLQYELERVHELGKGVHRETTQAD